RDASWIEREDLPRPLLDTLASPCLVGDTLGLGFDLPTLRSCSRATELALFLEPELKHVGGPPLALQSLVLFATLLLLLQPLLAFLSLPLLGVDHALGAVDKEAHRMPFPSVGRLIEKDRRAIVAMGKTRPPAFSTRRKTDRDRDAAHMDSPEQLVR